MYTADGRDGGYDYKESEFKAVSEHGFGHIGGLGDAYNTKNFRGGHDEVPNIAEVPHGNYFCDPASSIMYWNGTANANDVEMVLEAFITNKWQEYVSYGNVTRSMVIRK